MKVLVLAVLVALSAYVSANCGCLKCSKHLTVIGRTPPNVDCGGTTLIYRGVPEYQSSHSLPYKVQAPSTTTTTNRPAPANDLHYRIVEYTPSRYVKVVDSAGNRYDARIEGPAPVAAATTVTTTLNMKPCVDRVVVPAPRQVGGHERVTSNTRSSTTYTVKENEQQPTYVNEEIYVKSARNPNVYVNSNCEPKVNVQARPDFPVYIKSKQDQTIYCNSNQDSPIYSKEGPIYANTNQSPSVETVEYTRQTRGPSSSTVEKIERYINSVNSLGSTVQVGGVEIYHPRVKNRSRRDVPFLKPGYKFVMNMLPDFIQEPIKNTVNNLALTHPDDRLMKLYNRSPTLSLKDKLEIHRKKNLASLKNKLRNHILKNKPGLQKYTDDFYRAVPYGSSSYANHHDWPKMSRSNFERSPLSRPLDTYLDSLVYPNFIDQPQTKFLKSTKMENHRRLNGNRGRAKRESAYEKYWLKRFKKDTNGKKLPHMLEASEIVVPFYHVKEHIDDEENNSKHDKPWNQYLRSSPGTEKVTYNKYNYKNPWNEYLESSPTSDRDKYRQRRGSGQPFSVKDVMAENRNIKEAFLRNVIRDELKNFRVENHESQNMLRSTEDDSLVQMPHSSFLDMMTFPIKFIGNINQIAKEALPALGSLPKVVKGTKRYFKDFGKNFKKHFLHLTSDLIGDFQNMDRNRHIFVPRRHRRSLDQISSESNVGKTREKRYILKEVDEDEVEEYILEKLSTVFEESGYAASEGYTNMDSPLWVQHSVVPKDQERERKVMLEHVRPKLILDNNGKPFLEINGYKRPLWKKPSINKVNKSKMKQPMKKMRFHDASDEADREKIASLIDHAKNHLESNVASTYPEMPIKTVKERVSQLLYETDVLVHMDFEKYDGIYDDLIALQHAKRAIVQDWKRLIMSEAINDIGAKTTLLERFEELQHYKDLTLADIVASLYEDSENIFISKKLIKMLVRLQKLQCIINQVVSNFQHHLHISSRSEIAKEIEYVDLLDSLNFASKKSRNDMIDNLIKDRDVALHRNINVLDKLKKLLVSTENENKVEKESHLVWEMRNIEKMQKNTIEEMKYKLDAGYNIKNELKILFDLLKRYESCEADQKKLLSKFRSDINEEIAESEIVGKAKNKKTVSKKKPDLEELKKKWEDSLRKQTVLLKKKLKKNMRRIKKKHEDSFEDD